jgi:molybdopterin/thiamine biosynthesis adenylyltransferase
MGASHRKQGDVLTSNQWDRVERYLGNDTLAQLASKTVAVIGVGSGGGFAALTLAMSGVGNFVLIDDDYLEPSNAVRHVADLRYVEKSKVSAVADLILARNPKAKVTTHKGRLEDFPEALRGADLVVVGVDNERPKFRINELCREYGLTAVYAGVYERGEGGDVVVIQPSGEGPCYACWALKLREDTIDQGTGETELDYGMIGADGTLAAEPGLWLHVVRIASAQADLALNELLFGTSAHREFPANTVIMANVSMEILIGKPVHPYSAEWINIPRDPNCLVCGNAHGADVLSLENLLSTGLEGTEKQ